MEMEVEKGMGNSEPLRGRLREGFDEHKLLSDEPKILSLLLFSFLLRPSSFTEP